MRLVNGITLYIVNCSNFRILIFYEELFARLLEIRAVASLAFQKAANIGDGEVFQFFQFLLVGGVNCCSIRALS